MKNYWKQSLLVIMVVALLVFFPMFVCFGETVKIDHYWDNGETTVVHASSGDTVEVVIFNTCSEDFNYDVVGVKLREGDSITPVVRRGSPPPPNPNYQISNYITDKGACSQQVDPKLLIRYSPEYGIYKLTAKSKPGATMHLILVPKEKNKSFTEDDLNAEWKLKEDSLCPMDPATKQRDATCCQDERIKIIESKLKLVLPPQLSFDIQFIETAWRYDFAGAFTVSGLHDKKYAIDSSSKIIRAKDEESDASLGLAAFIHTYHDSLCNRGGFCYVPLSFGIGINDDSKVNYYAGMSLRFGQKAFLTVGANFGSVKTLPNGLSEGSTADANTLNNQKDRIGVAPFVSFSYTFLGSGQAAFNTKLAEKK